jgi:transaldolase
MAQNPRTAAISNAGVSLWLDDISRARLRSGGLRTLIETRNIVGVTTNPAIFQKAIANSEDYTEDVRAFARAGLSADEVLVELTASDVREACDVLRDTYDASKGVDGRVSIEVDPRLARDTESTVRAARMLWDKVSRPNVMIKIPATVEGLPAITEVIGDGISVNVTLIFSPVRYAEVARAYIAGLERAQQRGVDLNTIGSVASVFVSRVDGAVDPQLAADHQSLAGAAGLANARLCFAAYEQEHAGDRFAALRKSGARPQRPLWASTGVKNPDYSDTMYVDGLVAAGTVNTVPAATLEAVADHSRFDGVTIERQIPAARETLAQLSAAGVDLSEVTSALEVAGVAQFEDAWESLLRTTRDRMAGASAPSSGSARR